MSMNRVINNPDLVVEDMLTGWLMAHADTVKAREDNPRVVQRVQAPERGKVGIVTGGGSGHEPAFLGYVGDGLCDAVAVGEIFSSPTARSFLDAMRSADGGAGVACLYGNYAGDNMNVKMAMQMAAREGIVVRTVVANDDVPSAPKGDEAKRRGVAGEILMWKVGGAKAAMGGTLDEVIAVAQKAIASTRSIGVGLSACVIPAVGHANFKIEHGTMEVGIGHHGEPGIDVRKTVSAAEMAEMMLKVVLPDLPFTAGDRVAVLVSGLGATPVMEQYILYGEVARRLQAQGITVAVNFVGNLFTSLEMMGVTLTLMKLDDELEACLKAPASSVGLTVAGGLAAGRAYSAAVAGQAAAASAPVAAKAASASAARSVKGPAVPLAGSGALVRDLIATIVEHRQFLSDIDGLIGDGDHGINMAKGFTGCGTRLDALGAERAAQLPAALEQLSQALMDDIGGSMGPLYGNFFLGFVNTLEPHAPAGRRALRRCAGRRGGQRAGHGQRPGGRQDADRHPGARAQRLPRRAGGRRRFCRRAAGHGPEAAERGKDSTKDLQARIGRSARLGPRSIGVLDAGATSCWLILRTMAQSLQRQLAG
jgi:dihydroxyacetone kinase